MNRARAFSAVVIVMSSLMIPACRPIRSTSFIVGANTASLPGISQHGKLRWVSEELSGFVVQFNPASPCVGGSIRLESKPYRYHGHVLAEAACTVDKNMEGAYTYVILPAKADLQAAGLTAEISGKEVAFHADYCPLCTPGGASAAPPTSNPDHAMMAPASPLGPKILIGCRNNAAFTVDRHPSVSSGHSVTWEALGPTHDLKTSPQWEASFATSFCQEGRVFGTITANSPKTCTVADNQTAGAVSYTVTYKSATFGSCTGPATLDLEGR